MKKKEILDFLVKNKRKWELFSPCFVVNKKQLCETIKNIKKRLPGEIIYSHKTNPHPFVAKTANNHGCGFLLSSIEESEEIINNAGIDTEKIIFQSPSLTEQQFKRIKSLGISRFIIDSIEQLEIILSSLENMARKPEILVRINTGIMVEHSELGYSTDSYLGFPITEVLDIFKKLNELRKNNQITLGLHNHFFSQNTYLNLWRENLKTMADYVELLQRQGIILDVVDFGGGYPIYYGNKIPTFESIANLIDIYTKKMRDVYPDLRFIFEPGRKIVGESITLVAKIVHIKKFIKANVAILNCSVYNASMDTLIVHLLLQADKVDKNKKVLKEYVIRGSTPDSLDLFAKKINLPELKSGDHIAFFHAGAYSFCSDFISLKKPKHFII
jgi:ornithine decarboxylase